ncbi:caspase family protein [Candidatus Uabimicrobium amorphum]|uniref:Peptidase C14 caspase domain-containing protein n=1 Tax=Uabimicrobium amorphum TaxID=2596890 RepID=A0A5S9IQV1_UABAM|nr:caspase family protein [Candidatus Uabimicrobium amorphum]BBM86234.1 hypothetical protein UABAM_04620 [Candidatus Uabimicrobium amorphum]
MKHACVLFLLLLTTVWGDLGKRIYFDHEVIMAGKKSIILESPSSFINKTQLGDFVCVAPEFFSRDLKKQPPQKYVVAVVSKIYSPFRFQVQPLSEKDRESFPIKSLLTNQESFINVNERWYALHVSTPKPIVKIRFTQNHEVITSPQDIPVPYKNTLSKLHHREIISLAESNAHVHIKISDSNIQIQWQTIRLQREFTAQQQDELYKYFVRAKRYIHLLSVKAPRNFSQSNVRLVGLQQNKQNSNGIVYQQARPYFRLHKGNIRYMIVDTKKQLVASASDQDVILWDATQLQKICSWDIDDRVSSLCFDEQQNLYCSLQKTVVLLHREGSISPIFKTKRRIRYINILNKKMLVQTERHAWLWDLNKSISLGKLKFPNVLFIDDTTCISYEDDYIALIDLLTMKTISDIELDDDIEEKYGWLTISSNKDEIIYANTNRDIMRCKIQNRQIIAPILVRVSNKFDWFIVDSQNNLHFWNRSTFGRSNFGNIVLLDGNRKVYTKGSAIYFDSPAKTVELYPNQFVGIEAIECKGFSPMVIYWDKDLQPQIVNTEKPKQIDESRFLMATQKIQQSGVIRTFLAYGQVNWQDVLSENQKSKAIIVRRPREWNVFDLHWKVKTQKPHVYQESITQYKKQCAVVVGIGKYQFSDEFPNLKNPATDARALANLLKTKFHFSQVIELIDSEKSINAENIWQSLEKLKNDSPDALLFFYSGHGIPGYFGPTHDGSWISYRKLIGKINDCGARHNLLILDCCASGSIFKTASHPQKTHPQFPYTSSFRRVFLSRGFQVITSGTGNEKVLDYVESSQRYSPFAQLLFQKLQTPALHGRLLASELGQYIYNKQVSENEQNVLQAANYKRLYNNNGEFTFFSKPTFPDATIVQVLNSKDSRLNPLKISSCKIIEQRILNEKNTEKRERLIQLIIPELKSMLGEKDLQGSAIELIAKLAEQKVSSEFSMVIDDISQLLNTREDLSNVALKCLDKIRMYATKTTVSHMEKYVLSMRRNQNILRLMDNSFFSKQQRKAMAKAAMYSLEKQNTVKHFSELFDEVMSYQHLLAHQKHYREKIKKLESEGRRLAMRAAQLQKNKQSFPAKMFAAKATGLCGFAEQRLDQSSSDWQDASQVIFTPQQHLSGGQSVRLLWQSPVSRHHDKPIRYLLCSEDNKRIVSACENMIKVWNWQRKTVEATFYQPQKSICALAFSDNVVISAQEDGSLTVWYIDTQEKETWSTTLNFRISALAISPDEKFVVAGDYNGQILVWELNTRKLYAQRKIHLSDIKHIIFNSKNDRFISCGSDDKIYQLQTGNGKIEELFQYNKQNTSILDIALYRGKIATISEDQVVRIYTEGNSTPQMLFHSNGNHHFIRFCEPNYILLGGNKKIQIYDPMSGIALQEYNYTERITAMIRYCDTSLVIHRGHVKRSTQYNLLLGTNIGIIDTINVHKKSSIFAEKKHAHRTVESVVFHPDGETIYTGNVTGEVIKWNLPTHTHEVIARLDNKIIQLGVIDFPLQQKTQLFIANQSKQLLVVDDNRNGKKHKKTLCHKAQIADFCFLPDKQKVISVDHVGTLKLWQAQDKYQFVKKQDLNDGILSLATAKYPKPSRDKGANENFNIKLFTGHASRINLYEVSLPTSEKKLPEEFVKSQRETEIKYESSIETNSAVLSLCANEMFLVAGLANGEVLIFEKIDPEFTQEKAFKKIKTFTHGGRIRVVKIFGNILVSGSTNGTIQICDINSKEIIDTIYAHEGWVNDIDFNLANQMLVSVGADGFVKLWDLTIHLQIGNYNADYYESEDLEDSEDTMSSIKHLAISPTSSMIVSYHQSRTLVISDVQMRFSPKRINTDIDVTCIAFRQDGKIFACGTMPGYVFVYDQSGKLLAKFSAHKDMIKYITFSKDGKTMSTTSEDRTIHIWDYQKWEAPVMSLPAYAPYSPQENQKRVSSPDGRTIALINTDNSIDIVREGKRFPFHFAKQSRNIDHVALSSHNQGYPQILAYSQGEIIHICNVDLQKTFVTIKIKNIATLAVHHKGTLLAVGKIDGDIDLYDIPAIPRYAKYLNNNIYYFDNEHLRFDNTNSLLTQSKNFAFMSLSPNKPLAISLQKDISLQEKNRLKFWLNMYIWSCPIPGTIPTQEQIKSQEQIDWGGLYITSLYNSLPKNKETLEMIYHMPSTGIQIEEYELEEYKLKLESENMPVDSTVK